ncbi:hypothetical protein D9M70_483400 [compost metagenome]
MVGKFYQIEPRTDTGGTQERQPAALGGLGAELRGFVAVQLQQRQRHTLGHVGDVFQLGVDEQAGHRDEGPGGLGQRRRPRHVDVARALRVEHQPNRVRAGIDGGAHVVLAGQAADLDAGALRQVRRTALRLRHRTLHGTGSRMDRLRGSGKHQDT